MAGFGVDGEWAGGEVEGDFCGLAAGRIVQVCLGVAAGGSEEEVQLGGEAVVVRDDGVEGRFLVGLDALVGVRLERWEGGGVAVPDCVRVGERRAVAVWPLAVVSDEWADMRVCGEGVGCVGEGGEGGGEGEGGGVRDAGAPRAGGAEELGCGAFLGWGVEEVWVGDVEYGGDGCEDGAAEVEGEGHGGGWGAGTQV